MIKFDPPIHVVTLGDHTRKTLLENGFKEVKPDEFVKTEGTARTTWTRTHGSWSFTVSMLVGDLLDE